MKKTRILIVEDEVLTAKSLEKILEGFGYAVTGTVMTGEEAVDLAASDPPDLVLMDIRLAGEIDGIEAARKIIARRSVPVIFTTAHSDNDTLARAKVVGPHGYLIKPLNRNEIKSAIELALYRFNMEEKLIRSEVKYRELVDNINDVIYSIDENGIIVYISEQVKEISGYTPAELIGKSFHSFIHEDDRDSLSSIFVKRSEGYTELSNFRVRSKNGDILWFMAHGRPVVVNGTFRGIKGVMNDFTSTKRAEIELKQKNEELDAAYADLKREKNFISLIMEMSPAAIIMIDAGGVIVFANIRAEQVLGYARGEIVGKPYLSDRWSFLDFGGGKYPDSRDPIRAVLNTGKPVYDARLTFVRATGGHVDLSISASPLFDEGRGIEAVVLNVEDITAARKAEKTIRASLHEKEVLLREIHHRIKNNFQIILSLISLQVRYFADERDIRLMRQTQQRIRSIAVVYEKLYVSERISTIRLDEYIRDLSDEIFRTMDVESGLSITKDLEPVEVPVSTAITCGIIINELLTNVVKHAFEPGSGGRIVIECSTGSGEVVLGVSDNGRGLPQGARPAESESMGFQLIHALASQIGGELKFLPGQGAACVLFFPVSGLKDN